MESLPELDRKFEINQHFSTARVEVLTLKALIFEDYWSDKLTDIWASLANLQKEWEETI